MPEQSKKRDFRVENVGRTASRVSIHRRNNLALGGRRLHRFKLHLHGFDGQ
jgi:hypothetical protein